MAGGAADADPQIKTSVRARNARSVMGLERLADILAKANKPLYPSPCGGQQRLGEISESSADTAPSAAIS
jgi:hypothetical protein